MKCFFYLILLFCLFPNQLFAQTDLSLNDGQVWLGELKDAKTNSIFLSQLEIFEESAGSYLIISIPELFYSKFRIDFQLKENELLLEGHKQLTGYETDIKGLRKLIFDDGKIISFWSDKDNMLGDLSFSNVLSERQENYIELDNKMKQKYGLVEYGDIIESSEWKNVYESYKRVNITENVNFFQADGDIDMFGMQGKMNLKFMQPNSSYMRMNLASFYESIRVQTDTISWEYDSMENLTTVTKSPNAEASLPMFENSISDYQYVFQIQNVFVDGISAYKIKYNIDGAISSDYIDKERSFLIRSEGAREIMVMDNYTEVEGIHFPKLLRMIDLESDFTVNFHNINTNTFEVSVFEIPEEYKQKVVYNPVDSNDEATQFNEIGLEYLDNEDYEKAYEYFNKAVKADPSDYVIMSNRAIANQMLGNYYEAIVDYYKSKELGNNSATLLNRIGVCKISLGDYDNSINDFELSIDKDPTYLKAYENLLFAYDELEEYDHALELIDLMIDLDIDSTAYYNLGYFNLSKGNNVEAIEGFKKSIEEGYVIADLYNYLGVAQFREDQIQEALESYKEAYSMNPDEYYYQYNLADTYYHINNYEESEKFYISALTFETGPDRDLYRGYALTLRALGKYEDALLNIDLAIQEDQSDAELFDVKGLILYDYDKISESIEAFDRSIGMYPDDPIVYYWRGISHERLFNRHSACIDFQKSAEMGNEKAIQKLKQYCNLELNKDTQDSN